MRRLFLTVLAVILAGPVLSQDLPSQQRAAGLDLLRPLTSADDAQPWTGVGRLDTGVSFCTATLITDRLVLTAAHCLHHPETMERFPDRSLTFLAGLRNGRAEAMRGVRQSVVPAGYVPRSDPDLEGIGQDIALLELDLPVRSNRIAPIPTGRRAVRGLEVTVVSYGARREAHASIEEGCRVLEGAEDVRVLSCRVVQGSSGSPVMRIVDGVPEIVAVISASATDRQGAELSMAVALDRHVAALLGQLDGGTEAHGSRFDTLSGDGGRSQIGARFIRP